MPKQKPASLHIALPESLHERLTQLAAEEGMTMTQAFTYLGDAAVAVGSIKRVGSWGIVAADIPQMIPFLQEISNVLNATTRVSKNVDSDL